MKKQKTKGMEESSEIQKSKSVERNLSHPLSRPIHNVYYTNMGILCGNIVLTCGHLSNETARNNRRWWRSDRV